MVSSMISRRPNSMVLQLELAGLDLREIEDVVDDLQQSLGRARDGLRQPPLARRQLRSLQELRHSHHAVHRRADFVAHAREEFALGAARPFRRLFCGRRFGDRPLELAVGVAEIDRALFTCCSRNCR